MTESCETELLVFPITGGTYSNCQVLFKDCYGGAHRFQKTGGVMEGMALVLLDGRGESQTFVDCSEQGRIL
jgi:hypothetical protein